MSLIKQIILFGIAFLFTMVLSELFIRTSHLASVSSTEFYKDIGRGRRKSLNYLYFNEGFGIGKFNKYRYIGEANPPKKPNNTIRIALIGDSYVEAFQVFQRNYFGTITEKILTKKFSQFRIEVLNFGRSGFDIGDNYAYHKTLVEKFKPDMVLYFISNGDLEVNYSDILRPKTIIKNDTLMISYNFDKSIINSFEKTKFLTQHSAILNMLNIDRRKVKKVSILQILLGKVYYWFSPQKLLIESSEDYNIRTPINPITKKIIESLDSKKVVFVNKGSHRLINDFKKLCFENGFTIIDLSKPLDSMLEKGNDPNKWKITRERGHWNNMAHQVIGKDLAKQITKTIEGNN